VYFLKDRQKIHFLREYMETEMLARGLADLLAPFMASLLEPARADGREVSPLARAVWKALGEELEKNRNLRQSAEDIASTPEDADARAAFRYSLRKALSRNAGVKRIIEDIVNRARWNFRATPEPDWRAVLGGDDVLTRLEMIYLLRTGSTPGEVAKKFSVDVDDVFRLNASFSLAGFAGILSEKGIENWLDRLDRNDPLLRRLDMVWLLRSGTPVQVIARQYNAVEEYVERMNERFSRGGLLGILTEEDFDRFRSLYPPTIRVCSYNLHGNHNNGASRFRDIARGLAKADPHLAAFQEVLSGAGIEDTSGQISHWISSMTGYHYRSQFVYCHHFMEKYPEGVAIMARSAIRTHRTIDLTDLRDGLRPTMPRLALVAETEIFGHSIVFVSVHLDHNAHGEVRAAQVEKLLDALDSGKNAYCTILAGDFNEVEESPAIAYLRSAGYRDAYRECHKKGGSTFSANNPQSRIDYIFVKGNAAIVSSDLLLNDPELSDHIGVFAEIR
jgi:maltose 6'-phosphate phosphatase